MSFDSLINRERLPSKLPRANMPLPDPSANTAYQVYIVAPIYISLLLVVGAIRLYVKGRVLRTRTKDDMAYFIGIITTTAFIIMVIILIGTEGYVTDAGGAPAEVLTPDQFRLLLALQSFYSPVIYLAKLPLFLMYLEIFDSLKWMRISVWSTLVLTGVFSLVLTIFIPLACSPTSGFGASDYVKAITSPTCGTVTALSAVRSLVNVITDAILLILPMPAIWSLQMSTHRKWGVSAIVLTGLLGCVCSILMFVVGAVHSLSSQGLVNNELWSTTTVMWLTMMGEMTCALIVSNAPSLWIMVKKMFGLRLVTSRSLLRNSPYRLNPRRQGIPGSSVAKLNSSGDQAIWRTREYSVHIDGGLDSSSRVDEV